MKFKAAIMKTDDHMPGINNIIGFVEFGDFGYADIEKLFALDEVANAGYKLENYVNVPAKHLTDNVDIL